MQCLSPRLVLSLAFLLVGLAAANSTGIRADEAGYQKEVSVREPTRRDWVFAVANQLCELIVQDGQDETAVAEATRRLRELNKLASE